MGSKVIIEATEASSSGKYSNTPLTPGERLFDKQQMQPFYVPTSEYDSAELAYDSYDGEMSTPKKEIKKKEKIARKISKYLKDHPTLSDDDGNILDGPLNVKEGWIEVTDDLIVEDLAVWFGTKKKPKGSSQPKGPWVNICKKVDGKHPPCGRPEASDKSYPKCRAASVASHMSDSQKRAACQQKRKAEKSHPKSGTGNSPKMTHYEPKKKTNEEIVLDIIKKTIKEQWMGGMSPEMSKVNLKQEPALRHTYKCVPLDNSLAIEYALSNKLDMGWVRYAYGILGRESDWGGGKRYMVKAPFEYILNKLSTVNSTFRDVVYWIGKAKKQNWVPSMGIAQMTPDIAKKYNISIDQLMTLSGSLVGATKYLKDLYTQASQNYDIHKPTYIMSNGKLIQNPSSTGDGALDIAIASYNTGIQKLNKKWCKTNNPNLMAPCNTPNGKYVPNKTKNPNYVLTVYPNQQVLNYMPTLKFDKLSSIGYLKEVVDTVKKLNCLK